MNEMYKIGHLEVESPWGNAAGVVKSPEEAELMAHAGVGWVEAGSYTLERRETNSFPTEAIYYHNPETGVTLNSLGMPNPGADALEEQLPNMAKTVHALGKKLVVNVAPVSLEPIEESQELVARSYAAGADAVLLNTSCPNVIAEDMSRHEILSNNAEVFGEVILGLSDITQKYKPVFIRISPAETYEHMRSILRPLDPNIVSAVFATNSWPTQEVDIPVMGKSGPATADKSFQQLGWSLSSSMISDKKIDIVSSCGIINGRELQRRMDLGAAAGAGTTLYYESAEQGYSWQEATDKLLREFIDEQTS